MPFFGEIDSSQISLPVLTFMIGIADGFNPCAFFILTFLLSAMLLVQSRKRILVVGLIFIFFSALIYFLFMGAWLNVFLFVEEILFLTLIAGGIALIAGAINVKDYFFFQKGFSLTLPKSQKNRFMKKVNELIQTKSMLPLAIGTIILAVTVNLYELLCTVGFPMVYIRILTLRELPALEYYLYLAFYNLVYILPLLIIVLVFAITLGAKKFSVEWVKRLKLVSGLMISFLGIVLIFMPELLENIFTSFEILALAVLVSIAVMGVRKALTSEW